jgi:hypothetical protein
MSSPRTTARRELSRLRAARFHRAAAARRSLWFPETGVTLNYLNEVVSPQLRTLTARSVFRLAGSFHAEPGEGHGGSGAARQIRVADRQLADALAGGGENCVRDRRCDRRGAGLAYPAPFLASGQREIGFDRLRAARYHNGMGPPRRYRRRALWLPETGVILNYLGEVYS